MYVLRLFILVGVISFEVISPLRALGNEPQNIIIFKSNSESRGLANIPPASFSHSIHNTKNKCKDCHPAIFAEKIGASNITMKKNMSGEFCGKCHTGQMAFDLSNCDKCHKK